MNTDRIKFHADIDLPQVLPQVYAPAVHLHLLIRLLAAAGQLPGFLLPLAAEGIPLFHADKKSVEAAPEDRLFLPAFGIDRLKCQIHRLPVA